MFMRVHENHSEWSCEGCETMHEYIAFVCHSLHKRRMVNEPATTTTIANETQNQFTAKIHSLFYQSLPKIDK